MRGTILAVVKTANTAISLHMAALSDKAQCLVVTVEDRKQIH